jgi:hypothetical protein
MRLLSLLVTHPVLELEEDHASRGSTKAPSDLAVVRLAARRRATYSRVAGSDLMRVPSMTSKAWFELAVA